MKARVKCVLRYELPPLSALTAATPLDSAAGWLFFHHGMRTIGRLIVAGVLAFLVIGSAVLFHDLTGSRIVGQAVTPEGIELRVVQRFNWSGEPFTTSYYVRKPGTGWAWFYFDHEDWYWGRSRVALDTNARVATFYRGREAAIRYDWDREIYWRRQQAWSTGAQSYLPPGQPPR